MAGGGAENVGAEIESPSETEPVELQSSSSRRTEVARERFDRRTRSVWLTLMGHEDSLSRRISVRVIIKSFCGRLVLNIIRCYERRGVILNKYFVLFE